MSTWHRRCWESPHVALPHAGQDPVQAEGTTQEGALRLLLGIIQSPRRAVLTFSLAGPRTSRVSISAKSFPRRSWRPSRALSSASSPNARSARAFSRGSVSPLSKPHDCSQVIEGPGEVARAPIDDPEVQQQRALPSRSGMGAQESREGFDIAGGGKCARLGVEDQRSERRILTRSSVAGTGDERLLEHAGAVELGVRGWLRE